MATQLFKLAIDAATTTDVEINPDIDKYFYLLDAADRTDDVLTIPANKFTDDAGVVMVGNLTTATANGYYLLFINGVLQQSSLYVVSGDGSQVTVNDAETIPVGAPITLIVNNFAATSDSDTTVTT